MTVRRLPWASRESFLSTGRRISVSAAISASVSVRYPCITSIFLLLADKKNGTTVHTQERDQLWQDVKKRDPKLYRKLRSQVNFGMFLPEQDAAIAALEAKREKYVRIKEGMMRDLLTGKVRMKGE